MMAGPILALAASLAFLAGSGQGESLWWVFLNTVLMLRSADAKEADALFAADPAVRAGHMAVELHPQYLADGILGEATRR